MNRFQKVALALLFAGGGLLFGQEFGLIVHGGPGWVAGSDWRDALTPYYGENKARFDGGIALSLRGELGGHLAAETRIGYQSAGGTYTYLDPDLGEDVDGKISTNIIEIPILLLPWFPTANNDKVFLLFGPAAVVLLGDFKQTESIPGVSVTSYTPPDNRIVLGIVAGIGYSSHLSTTGTITTGIEYRRTITKIFDDDNMALTSVAATLGYLW